MVSPHAKGGEQPQLVDGDERHVELGVVPVASPQPFRMAPVLGCRIPRPDWRSSFLDYSYVGYNTATAFRPSDALPITPRAKMSMMVQRLISLLILVVGVSRVINVLPG